MLGIDVTDLTNHPKDRYRIGRTDEAWKGQTMYFHLLTPCEKEHKSFLTGSQEII